MNILSSSRIEDEVFLSVSNVNGQNNEPRARERRFTVKVAGGTARLVARGLIHHMR